MNKKLILTFLFAAIVFGVFVLSACTSTGGSELLGGAGIGGVTTNDGILGGDADISLEPSPTIAPVSTPVSTDTPIPTPTPLGIGSTLISGDMTMVYVPAGDFTMGSSADKALADCQQYRTDCERDWFVDEEPAHAVYLDAFWIDQTEVTNAMYANCVTDGVCKPLSNFSSANRSPYYGNPEFDAYPVVFVDWDMANAYCSWAGRRLPTEAEWEKAARGTDARAFPWGDNISCAEANYLDLHQSGDHCAGGDTTRVGSYESGKSVYGAYDMAGNVWEWVNDWYDPTYYQYSPTVNPSGPEGSNYRVLRGGSWFGFINDVRSVDRLSVPPFFTNLYAGFRCASSAAQ